jgi:predicted NBD/HSP70 family sugar kinase
MRKAELRALLDPYLPRAEGAIRPEELVQLLQAGRVSVVDTREAPVFKRAHLPGAINLPIDEIETRLKVLRKSLGSTRARALHGVGIAAPLSLGGWQTLLGSAAPIAGKWAQIDIRARVAAMTDVPVTFVKDTAAACVAELVSGSGRSIRSYLYVFVDTFVGGGLVIDSHLHAGRHGNAGAIGSLPIAVPRAGRGGVPEQLLSVASLLTLETRYAGAGLDPSAVADERAMTAPWRTHTNAWLRQAATGVAMAVNSAVCLLDLDGVIVDGSFSRPLLQALLDELSTALDHHNWEGVSRPTVLPGTIGSDARALGGLFGPGRGPEPLERAEVLVRR